MTAQPNCKARIEAAWKSTKADLTRYMNEPDVYENGDENLPPFHEYGLGFDYVEGGTDYNDGPGYWRYQFSWGGPSDELRFYGDPAGVIHCVEYWFLDWFDGAHIDVTAEPCVKWLVEWFEESGCFVAELEKATEQ